MRALVMLMGFAWASWTLGDTPIPDLRAQIRNLAATHSFQVQGLHKLGDDPGRPVAGGVPSQLKELLRDFNYIVSQSESGAIDRVLISSRKTPAAATVPGYQISTTRRGNHHVVTAVLVGPNGAYETTTLIVDTGASAIVLPASLSEALGFRESELQDSWSQTANGKVRIRSGTLDSVRVGRAESKGVAVSFVADEALGGNALLGMSFLSRFRITIDDHNQRLILMHR